MIELVLQSQKPDSNSQQKYFKPVQNSISKLICPLFYLTTSKLDTKQEYLSTKYTQKFKDLFQSLEKYKKRRRKFKSNVVNINITMFKNVLNSSLRSQSPRETKDFTKLGPSRKLLESNSSDNINRHRINSESGSKMTRQSSSLSGIQLGTRSHSDFLKMDKISADNLKTTENTESVCLQLLKIQLQLFNIFHCYLNLVLTIIAGLRKDFELDQTPLTHVLMSSISNIEKELSAVNREELDFSLKYDDETKLQTQLIEFLASSNFSSASELLIQNISGTMPDQSVDSCILKDSFSWNHRSMPFLFEHYAGRNILNNVDREVVCYATVFKEEFGQSEHVLAKHLADIDYKMRRCEDEIKELKSEFRLGRTGNFENDESNSDYEDTDDSEIEVTINSF